MAKAKRQRGEALNDVVTDWERRNAKRTRAILRRRPGTVTPDEVNEALLWVNSYTRLPTIIKLHTRRGLGRGDLFLLLGENWSICDNVWQCDEILRVILPDGVVPEMMDDAERAALAGLPTHVTVYRGADRGVNEQGLSWTIDQAVAEKFPLLNRYRAKQPVLVTATVRHEHIIAVMLSRQEAEVITKRAVVSSVVGLRDEKGGGT